MRRLDTCPKCRISKKQLLEQHYGGQWQYKGFAGWVSDDGRFVVPVSNGVDEFDNPLGGPFRYFIYGHGKPEEVKWWELNAKAPSE